MIAGGYGSMRSYSPYCPGRVGTLALSTEDVERTYPTPGGLRACGSAIGWSRWARGDTIACMQSAREYFNYLNHAYTAVHKAKEDLFWATYMATSSDQAGFVRTESAYKEFIGDPAKLAKTREELAAVRASPPGAERDALLHGLGGWLALFEANIIDSPDGRSLMREIVDAESVLFEQKRAHELRHLNERGESEAASLPMLATNLVTNRVEERRKSSFDALRGVEHWVLEHGFLEVVRLRNRFARALGYADYFALKLQKNERMTTAALMRLLDDFVRQTDAANARVLADLRQRQGNDATTPWNLRFHASGDVVRRLDAYMPFGLALRRWIDSFRRLGIQFRGATMQLDLLERPGKHQNGSLPRSTSHRRRNPTRSAVASGLSTLCSTRAATPRTSPMSCRTRRASRRNIRRRRWPTRKRSRCSATSF